MTKDIRTTAQVEKTRCLLNRKPYRGEREKQSARTMAHRVKGTMVSPAPRSFHDRCSCGKVLFGKGSQCCSPNVNSRI
jgi:hypothetical protein